MRRAAQASALALFLLLSAEGHFLGHSPPVVPTPWKKSLLPCVCANATLDCSERGKSSLTPADRCGGSVSELNLFDNVFTVFPDGFDAAVVVNASRNRFQALPRAGQLSARVRVLALFDNRIANVQDELRHLASLQTLRLSRNQGIAHLRFLPDPCGLVHLEVGDNSIARLDGPLRQCVHLEALDLSSNNLSSLPEDAFSLLRGLRVLDLSSNSVAPFSPQMFATLTQLIELRLDATGAESLPEGLFSNLSQLAFLSLESNPLSQLSGTVFHGLERLRYFSLDSTRMLSLPKDGFGNLTSLEELYLSDNALTTVPSAAFSTLPRLKLISLSGNNISSLPSDAFSGLLQLDTLFIMANNPLLIIPSGLPSSLPNLQLIALSQPLFQNHFLQEMINVSYIQCFHCGITSLPSRSFYLLSNTKALSIHGSDIKSISEDAFIGLSTLTYLSLDGNNIISLPALLFSPLHNLTRLHLSSNSLRVLRSDIFVGLSRVKELALDHNDISELPHNLFQDMHSLERLDVSNNDLITLPEGIFANLSTLWELNIANNKLTHLPMFPPGCTGLKAVSFARNAFSHLDETTLRSWLFSEGENIFLNLEDRVGRIPLESVRWVTAQSEVILEAGNKVPDSCSSVLLIRRRRTLVRLCTSSTSLDV